MAGYAAGLFKAHIWLVGPSGYMYGQTRAPVAGTVYPAYICHRAKTANLAYIDPTEVDAQGGDKTLYSFLFGNTKLNAFDLILSDVDPSLMTLIANTADNVTTNTSFELFSNNPNLSVPTTCGLALTQRYQPTVVGSPGPDQFLTIIIPRCYIRPKFGGMAYQANAPVTFKVTTAFSNVDPLGLLFASSGLAQSMEGDVADHYGVISQYPITFAMYYAAGAATSFTVPVKPVSSVVTINASPNWMTINGVTTAPTSLVPSTGVITIPSATVNNVYELMYQCNYQFN